MEIEHFLTVIVGFSMQRLAGATLIEWLGAVLGVIYVIAEIRELAWCWWAALASTLAYVAVFTYSALYGQTLLQVYYVLASMYGYWAWQGSNTRAPVQISTLSLPMNAAWIGIGLVGSALVAWFLHIGSEFTPLMDVFTTVGSLVATALATRKHLESWLWWVVMDGLIAYLCLRQGLWLTAILYAGFVVLSVWGYCQWRQLTKRDTYA